MSTDRPAITAQVEPTDISNMPQVKAKVRPSAIQPRMEVWLSNVRMELGARKLLLKYSAIRLTSTKEMIKLFSLRKALTLLMDKPFCTVIFCSLIALRHLP